MARPDAFDPFWIASRPAAVLGIGRKADIFLNGAGSSNLPDRYLVALAKMITGEPNPILSLVAIDGKEHKDLRAGRFRGPYCAYIHGNDLGWPDDSIPQPPLGREHPGRG